MEKNTGNSGGQAGKLTLSPEREQLTEKYINLLRTVRLTGREIARLSGTRPQYISDIKRKQRPLSDEMYTRTLVGLFGDYKWLISGDFDTDTSRIVTLFPYIRQFDGPVMALPVLDRPFAGPKMTAGDWDGAFFCVASPVRERAKAMHNPYILHLPFNDRSGRLRRGDYLLVDQKESIISTCLLAKSGWGVKLLRKNGDIYEDVESGEVADKGFSVIGNVDLLLMGSM